MRRTVLVLGTARHGLSADRRCCLPATVVMTSIHCSGVGWSTDVMDWCGCTLPVSVNNINNNTRDNVYVLSLWWSHCESWLIDYWLDLPDDCRTASSAVASLRWVTPGRQLRVSPLYFFLKNLATFFSRHFCGVTPDFFFAKNDDLFCSSLFIAFTRVSPPPQGCRPTPFLYIVYFASTAAK